MKKFGLLCLRGLGYLLSLSFIALVGLIVSYLYLENHLPDVETLKNIQLQVPLRIYSADKQLIAEYGEKRRIPITLQEIPKPLINGLLATEDQRFYDHPGVDVLGLVRAAVQLLRTGKKIQGGSTITMQVARNFFLERKKTYIRKINEILLAIKIDHELSKDKILELYFNKIYFGYRAYGVAAAAQVYYGKPLKELTLPQMAMIAGLPKAPSLLNPLAHPIAAKRRRNHVLTRMLIEKYIDEDTYKNAVNASVTATYHGRKVTVKAPYAAEMIRQALTNKYGKGAYTNGYQVFTTIDSRLQTIANRVTRHALLNYDEHHGYRGAIKNVGSPAESELSVWLQKLHKNSSIANLYPAIVVSVEEQSARVLLQDGQVVSIPWSGMKWARPQYKKGRVGPTPHTANTILKPGDLIRIRQEKNNWRLAQVPQIEGALISLDPHNGAILALTGGFDFYKSKFNRITQAKRQPGSSFKPFIYAAALEKGYTLASIINDAPIVLDDPSQLDSWRPQNDTRRFYGPTRLRIGLIRSRNLVSIRILEGIGIPYTIKYLEKFGFKANELPKTLSLALGSLDTTPLKLAGAYATFANGGFQVAPYLVDHIDDAEGETILVIKPKVACLECAGKTSSEKQQAKRVLDQRITYLMHSALQDVILHGTGRAAKVLNRQDLAGKTGTTNDQIDAWFAGFNGDLVTVTWMGFDQPKSIHEYAARTALPMWIDFMKEALEGKPESTMLEPPGLVTVKIDPETGLLARTFQKKSMFEIFRQEYAPQEYTPLRLSPEEDAERHDSVEDLF